MTTTLQEVTARTEARLRASDKATYDESAAFNPPSLRAMRKFKYSKRRMYKQNKMYAVSAIAGCNIYCNFLGPSGVTLLAATSDTIPTLTWLRYPVSYCRRRRFFNAFTNAMGATDANSAEPTLTGVGMTVYIGTPAECATYISFVTNKVECVTVATTGKDSQNQDVDAATLKTAKQCGFANNWIKFQENQDGTLSDTIVAVQ